MQKVLVGLALMLGLAACGGESSAPVPSTAPPESAMTNDTELAADLATLAGASIYFAHMSVGGNVLQGVQRVAGERLALAAYKAGESVEAAPGRLAHQGFGQNGDPAAKLAAFGQSLSERVRPAPDVALMKFCYADFGPADDPAALFERYRTQLAAVRAAHPGTVLVHVTMPLTVRDTGVKDWIKRWTGASDGFAQANIRRAQYNARLREAFAGEPIFDLARVESHWPDGREESFTRGGAAYPALVPEYSDDGHHLAGAGQDRAARELVHVLAAAVRSRAAH